MLTKDESLEKIAALIEAFGKQHFDDELTGYALKLCGTLSRKRKLNIARGKKEIWQSVGLAGPKRKFGCLRSDFSSFESNSRSYWSKRS